MYDWNDPFARMFLQILAVIAEFIANLIRQRTLEGMARARRQGKASYAASNPNCRPSAARTIRRRYAVGEVSLADLAEEYSVGRSAIHRIIHRPEPETAAQDR